MSNINEERKNNFITNKRKANSIIKKRLESKNKKSPSKYFSLEKSTEKDDNNQFKSFNNNKKMELSKSCKNFNKYQYNLDNENYKEITTDNHEINLNLKRMNFVPRINRHKRNLNKYLRLNKDDNDNNNKNFNKETESDLINISHNNYRKKPRCISTEVNNTNKNNKNKKFKLKPSHSSTNVNSANKSPKKNLYNNTYSIEIPNYLCDNCYNQKLLQEKYPYLSYSMNNKELLTDKFINENPFYFIDQMKHDEKNRIHKRIDKLSTKQKLALSMYENEINLPRNLKKEKLQLINEYSLNPLAIYHKKDPKFLEKKKIFDKKEKLIIDNPDIYQGLGPRKALRDYYQKCVYQVPKLEESYKINPVYKKNYIKVLKKQIEDKKIKEKEIKKRTRISEYIANKNFDELNKKERLYDLNKKEQERKKLIDDNNKLQEYKKNKKEIKDEEEKKYRNKLNLMKDRDTQNIKIRNKKDKELDCEMYQKMIDDMNKKKEMKINNEIEEKKKWNNYLDKYNLKYSIINRHNNCDGCNRAIKNQKLKKISSN